MQRNMQLLEIQMKGRPAAVYQHLGCAQGPLASLRHLRTGSSTARGQKPVALRQAVYVTPILPLAPALPSLLLALCSSRVHAAGKTGGSQQAQTSAGSKGDKYFNVTGYPFPLGPITRRSTIRREVSTHPVGPCIATLPAAWMQVLPGTGNKQLMRLAVLALQRADRARHDVGV